jgi:hypothetical protein
MKTHFFKVVTFCAIAAFLGACDKDSTTRPTQEGTAIQSSQPIERLRSFRKHLEAAKAYPNLRNTETTTVEETLWDVENYFNMTYSDPEQYYASTTDHEFSLILPVNDQQVDVSDAVTLYHQVTEEARQSLISDNHENKGFVSLAIKETENANNGLRITFIGKTGERCAYNPNPYPYSIEGPFHEDDNWYFASPMGKCDDPDIPSGADKQLQEKLYDLLIGSLPEAQAGNRTVFLDRKHIIFDGQNFSGVYYSCDPDRFCIPYPNMNWHFRKEKEIITEIIPDMYHLTNYQPISIEINAVVDDDEGCGTHRNEIEYGIPCQVSINEFGNVEALIQP